MKYVCLSRILVQMLGEKGVEKEKSLSWRQEIAKTAENEENCKSTVAEEGA